MDNKELDQQLYKYPGTNVLSNKLGIKDRSTLDRIEQELVSDRIVEGAPCGNFDLKHLQAIHHHLFQDIYEWAGQIRQTQIHKGSSMFMPPNRIEFGFQDVHKRLKGQNYLEGLPQEAFTKKAGVVMGDINYAHPFREGNGRAQLQYLKQLGERAGYKIDLSLLDKEKWIEASIDSVDGKYDRMSKCIQGSVTGRVRNREKDRDWERDS